MLAFMLVAIPMTNAIEQGNLRFANIGFSGSPRVTLYVDAANVLTRLFLKTAWFMSHSV
jgi:hypothetical protein